MTSKKLIITLLIILIVTTFGVSVFLISQKYNTENQNIIVSSTNTTPKETIQVSSDTISQIGIDKLPGCITAFSPVSPEITGFTKETQNNIIHYRQSWQDVCSGKSERSLYPLWVEAEELTQLSHKDQNGYKESDLCYIEKTGGCPDITSFTPGIEGMFAEGTLQDFKPSIKLFAENSILGTQEDKDFFASYLSLNLDSDNGFPPWISQTWDYGGCTLYGEYNWVNTLQTLDNLSEKIKNKNYTEQINSSRKDVIDAITSSLINYNYDYDPKFIPHICSCDKKEAVFSDVEKVLKYTKGNVIYNDTSYGLNDFIAKINAGRAQVLSENDQHCSGG